MLDTDRNIIINYFGGLYYVVYFIEIVLRKSFTRDSVCANHFTRMLLNVKQFEAMNTEY